MNLSISTEHKICDDKREKLKFHTIFSEHDVYLLSILFSVTFFFDFEFIINLFNWHKKCMKQIGFENE